MNVFLVDDHPLMREGLVTMLAHQPEFHVVGHSSSGQEALDYARAHSLDILVTDHSMPGMDGLTLVRKMHSQSPGVHIIVLTMHEETHLYREMEKEGVKGYVLKQDSSSDLVRAILAVSQGETFVSPRLKETLDIQKNEPDSGWLLTKREREILQLIVKELPNREIAEALFISELTVETHRKNIFRKTGASSLVGLVNFAHANGLMEP